MNDTHHRGKPTSIYLNEDNKHILDKIIIPERKRLNAKASRSEYINLLLTKFFIKKGLLNSNGTLKTK